jgi:hypothetical protein
MTAIRRAAVTMAGLLVFAAFPVTSLGFYTGVVYRALSNSLGDFALLIVQFRQR